MTWADPGPPHHRPLSPGGQWRTGPRHGTSDPPRYSGSLPHPGAMAVFRYYLLLTLCRFLAQRGPEEIHEGDQEVCDHRQDLQQEQQQPQQRACVLQQQHQQPQQQLWLQEHKEVIFQQ